MNHLLYIIGYYLLPVSTLIEPPEELLVRVKSEKFIEGLKEEMLENPTCDVQPMLCVVRLKEDEEFDDKKVIYMKPLVATIRVKLFNNY